MNTNSNSPQIKASWCKAKNNFEWNLSNFIIFIDKQLKVFS